MEKTTNIAEFAAANAAAVTTHLNELLDSGQQVVAVPKGHHIEDLERFQALRRQARGRYETNHFGDFLEYAKVNSVNSPEREVILFINPVNMGAEAIFDYNAGHGHARNRAVYIAQFTEAVAALLKLCARAVVEQEDVIRYLEDWADDAVPYNSEGGVMAVATAVSVLRNLTLERAKTIKQLRGDFAYEQSTAEKATLRRDGEMVAGIELRDVVYQGTNLELRVQAKLSLVLAEDKFFLSLRLVGEDSLNRAKTEEMVAAAKAQVNAPVYCGTYDAL